MKRAALALLGVLLPAASAAAQEEDFLRSRRDDPALPVREEGGPWGPDGFGLVWRPPVWRGFLLSGGMFSGDGLELSTARAIVARSNGVDPVLTASLDYDEKDFEAAGATATWDFDFFRLSLHGFAGDFEARGRLTVTDGVNPAVETSVETEGDFYGLRVGLHWPGLRLRSGAFEASLGPNLTAGWQHEEVTEVPGSPLPIEDSVDEFVGTIAPRLSVRILADRFAFTLEGEVGRQFGSSDGTVFEFAFGLGWAF